MLEQYFPIAVFVVFAIILASAINFLPYLLKRKNVIVKKASLNPYECGFDAFSDAREKFDVKFYVVAVLFIIFDIEVAFLMPWALTLGTLGALGFFSMIAFLAILALGFVYEWKSGALDW